MKMTIGTRLSLGFAVQILLTVVLGASVLIGMANMHRQFQGVAEHDAPMIANARQLSKLVVDMETGQRGFVITGLEPFLEPYTLGAMAFDNLIATQKTLVGDNRSQVAELDRIARLVEQWKQTAARPEIAMAKKVANSRMDAQQLQDILAQGVGKALMDRFMAVRHELEASFSERDDWEGAFVVERIEKSMADKEDGQRGFLITGREDFLEKYHAAEQTTLPQLFARLRAVVSQRGRDAELSEQVDQLEALAREWTTRAAEPEIAARREMNAHPETAKDVAALLQTGTGKRLIDTIRRALDRFVEIEEALAADRYAMATQTAATARTTAVFVLIIAIGLGISLAVAASRAISGPLTRLVVGAEAVGTGDFATRVVVESTDEIGDLAQAFNGMVSRLEDAASQRDRLEAQLRHAQKLESIGQLAAGIAHEINTPAQYVNDNTRFLEQSFGALIPILKKVDQLAASVPKRTASSELADEVTAALEEADIDYLTEEIPRAIEQSLHGLDRVRKIVQSMNEFSHPDGQGMTSIDLNHAIESTITVATAEWKYVAEVETDFDPDLPRVECLPSEINQVILNLIVNAAHAIGDVMGDGDGRRGTITIRTRRDGACVEIRVEDTGTGIPEAVRDRIFDPFFTTKEVGKGTGQGLSMTHAVVVKKHGGTVRFETEVGKGTTFIIRLPLDGPRIEVAA